MATSVYRIRKRIQSGRYLEPWKRKAHDFRRIVAGDYSPIDPKTRSQIDPHSRDVNKRVSLQYLLDILVTDFEEGTTNYLAQVVRTLLAQAAFRFPAIDFEDLEPDEQAFNTKALYARLSAGTGCNAATEQQLTLISHIIDGMGITWLPMIDGMTTVQNIDTLDCVWDQNARHPHKWQWACCYVRDSLGAFVSQLGEEHFKKELDKGASRMKYGVKDDTYLEEPMELVCYYDLDDWTGTYAVMKSTGDFDVAEEPVIEPGDNPHVMASNGVKECFLPLIPSTAFKLPSVRMPYSTTELAIPGQIATRNAERSMDKAVRRMAPWYDVEEDSYEQDVMDAFEEGEWGAVLFRKSGKAPPTAMQGFEIPQSVVGWYQQNKQNIVSMSGVSPYASGNKVEGIKYAAEVRQIGAEGQLIADLTASDHALHWQNVVSKVMWNMAILDSAPLAFILEGKRYQFGPGMPVGTIMRPDAEPLVREDSMRFEAKDAKIARAQMKFKDSLAAAAFAPMAQIMAFQDLLRAYGEKNIAQYLQSLPVQADNTQANSGDGGQGAPSGGGMGVSEQAAAETQ